MNRFKKILSILLLSSLLMTSALSQDEDGGLLRIHVNDFSGGMDSFNLPNVIEANQGVLVKNVILNRRGRLKKRKGVSIFAQDLSDVAWTGIGRFTPTATNDFLITASGGVVLRSTSVASWIVVNQGSPVSVTANKEFVQADKLLFILDGVNFPPYYDGTTYTEGIDPDDQTTQTTTSAPIAKYGAWLRNYLFLTNGAVEKDWIWFSNNLRPLHFTEGDIVKVNTGDGQQVQWIKPFKLNELIVYKERSTWLLDITGVTPLVDWSLQPIIEDIGLIAPRTVASVGNDQWFLSSEPIGIRSLIRTNLDKIKTSLISVPVQDIFDGSGPSNLVINKTVIEKAAAVFFDNKYLLSYPAGISTVNNTVLVFDLIPNSWYLITGWFVENWEIFDNNLYFIDSTDGRVLQAFDGNNDIASGPITTPVDEDGIIASDPAVSGPDFHFESKAFDFDSPELFKFETDLEVIAGSTGDFDLEVFINMDGGGFQSVGTMSLAGESTNLPIDLPFTLSSEKLARKMFQLNRYGEWKEIQIGFNQSAIDETVEIRSFTIFSKKRSFRRQ